mgnify:FL=1
MECHFCWQDSIDNHSKNIWFNLDWLIDILFTFCVRAENNECLHLSLRKFKMIHVLPIQLQSLVVVEMKNLYLLKGWMSFAGTSDCKVHRTMAIKREAQSRWTARSGRFWLWIVSYYVLIEIFPTKLGTYMTDPNIWYGSKIYLQLLTSFSSFWMSLIKAGMFIILCCSER